MMSPPWGDEGLTRAGREPVRVFGRLDPALLDRGPGASMLPLIDHCRPRRSVTVSRPSPGEGAARFAPSRGCFATPLPCPSPFAPNSGKSRACDRPFHDRDVARFEVAGAGRERTTGWPSLSVQLTSSGPFEADQMLADPPVPDRVVLLGQQICGRRGVGLTASSASAGSSEEGGRTFRHCGSSTR